MLCFHAAQTGKHLLRTQNVSKQNQKHFLCPGHKICVRNKCCTRGQTGKHLCRQQCVLVCQGHNNRKTSFLLKLAPQSSSCLVYYQSISFKDKQQLINDSEEHLIASYLTMKTARKIKQYVQRRQEIKHSCRCCCYGRGGTHYKHDHNDPMSLIIHERFI